MTSRACRTRRRCEEAQQGEDLVYDEELAKLLPVRVTIVEIELADEVLTERMAPFVTSRACRTRRRCESAAR